MSREAFGDPPEEQEPPQICPVCGGEWHTEGCEFGEEVSRRLKAERDAHKLAFENAGLRREVDRLHGLLAAAQPELALFFRDLRNYLLHVIDMSKGEHYLDVVRLNAQALIRRMELLAAQVTGDRPLRRNVDGVCTRSTCECEREGLGDQCVWLKPAEAEFECLGEPSLCDNPRGCDCPKTKP